VTNNLPAAQYLADYENLRIFTLPGMVRGVTSAASTSGPAGGWAG
jgi:DeoR family fructose operon transcriptional repressor